MSSSEAALSGRRRARWFWLVLAALWLSVALIDWMAPIQGDDWTPRYWLLRRGAGLGSLAQYVLHHRTIGELVELVLSAIPITHVVLTPTLMMTFIVGLIAVAAGRVPRPRDPDGWMLVLVASALVWVGAPRAGLDFYYRAYVAHFVAGLTATVWLFHVWFDVEVRPGRGRAIACFLLGLAAGTSNHFVVPIVVWVLWKQVRARRKAGPLPAWRWAAFAGLVAGGVLLFTQRPYIPIHTILTGGFEHNLFKLYLFMGECGELVAVVLIAFFALLFAAKVRPPGPPMPGLREIALAGRAFGMALVAAFLSILSPRWGEPAMLASVAGMVVATLALWLAPLTHRVMRIVIVVLSVIVHVLVLAYAIPRYLEVRGEYAERMAIIESTPARGVAHIDPFRKTVQDSWFVGEDMMTTTSRGLVAEIYGLRTIEYNAPFGGYQPSADFHFDEVLTTGPNKRRPLLTDDLEIARAVFAEDILALWRSGWRGDAYLEMTGFDWPGRNGRPLIAMRYYGDGRVMYVPEAADRPMDKNMRIRIRYYEDSIDGDYPDSVIVAHGQEIPATVDDDVVAFFPQTSDRYVLLQCRWDECWVMIAPWIQL